MLWESKYLLEEHNMKGVILAGGFAKRMSPCSKTINKHLMPVYIKNYGAIPMIYFPINTLINSGIKEILIITSDEAAGLMIDSLGDGRKFGDGVDFTYKIQNMHPFGSSKTSKS